MPMPVALASIPVSSNGGYESQRVKKLLIWFCVSYVLLKKYNTERLRLSLDLAGGNWLFVAY
jgi:hypothetical protein